MSKTYVIAKTRERKGEENTGKPEPPQKESYSRIFRRTRITVDAEKDYMYQKLWGKYLYQKYYIFFADRARSKLISEICNFCVLSMAQQNYMSDSQGNEFSARRALELRKWPPGELVQQ